MYTYGYLFYIPVTIIFVIIFGLVGLVKKRPYPYFLFALIAVIYINKAIELTIFPIFVTDVADYNIFNNMSFGIALGNVNVKHMILNLLLTLPIGLGIQFVTNYRITGRVVVTVLCGMSFEILQLLLLIVIKPLNIFFDMSDLLSNIVGSLLGLVIVSVWNHIFVNSVENGEKINVLSYIKKVSANCVNKKNSLDFDV